MKHLKTFNESSMEDVSNILKGSRYRCGDGDYSHLIGAHINKIENGHGFKIYTNKGDIEIGCGGGNTNDFDPIENLEDVMKNGGEGWILRKIDRVDEYEILIEFDNDHGISKSFSIGDDTGGEGIEIDVIL